MNIVTDLYQKNNNLFLTLLARRGKTELHSQFHQITDLVKLKRNDFTLQNLLVTK